MQEISPKNPLPPSNGTSLWMWLRIAVLLLGLLQSEFLIGSMKGDFSKAAWPFAIEMICLVSFGILFVLFIQSTNPRSAPRWYKPSWFHNPFNYKQPVQIFHMGAFYFLASGIGCFFLGISRPEVRWLWELPVSIGCGLWLGVRCSVAVFRDKFQ